MRTTSEIQDGCQTLTARPISSDKFITSKIYLTFLLCWEKNKSETHTQIQTSRSTNIVPSNLPILGVTEPRNNMSYLCRSVFQYGSSRAWTSAHLHHSIAAASSSGVCSAVSCGQVKSKDVLYSDD